MLISSEGTNDFPLPLCFHVQILELGGHMGADPYIVGRNQAIRYDHIPERNDSFQNTISQKNNSEKTDSQYIIVFHALRIGNAIMGCSLINSVTDIGIMHPPIPEWRSKILFRNAAL